MTYFRAFLGIIFLVGVAFLLSNNKKKIDWSLVFKSFLLQVIIAFLAFKIKWFTLFFEKVSLVFVKVYQFSGEGAKFLFGSLIDLNKVGWIFAFQVLPSLIFFSALFSFLYYIRILPRIINAMSWIMQRTLKISGAESLTAAGNIFLGQSETPLLIKPILPQLTRSEMNCMIVGGFATVSGAILGSASGMLGGGDITMQHFYANQFLIASILSAPAAILFAKIMVPETEEVNSANYKLGKEHLSDKNPLDAISSGTFDGLKLAANVGAMLIVFVALIALINFVLNKVGHWTNLNDYLPYTNKGLSLQYIFGLAFSPVAWIIGTPVNDIFVVGQLIGEKTVINEFFAYTTLTDLINGSNPVLTNKKSIMIATYALCGFSNFSSIGIMIGGISALSPNKRPQVVELSLKALIGGTLACLMTAAIAGVFF